MKSTLDLAAVNLYPATFDRTKFISTDGKKVTSLNFSQLGLNLDEMHKICTDKSGFLSIVGRYNLS